MFNIHLNLTPVERKSDNNYIVMLLMHGQVGTPCDGLIGVSIEFSLITPLRQGELTFSVSINGQLTTGTLAWENI